MFSSADLSHQHSLKTLEALYEYDDFMQSIGTLVDLGCGTGLDLEWWATRTTRDEVPVPLNIKCTGVDLDPELLMAYKYPNIQYYSGDFEQPITMQKRTFDLAWCHDSFQYVINPFETLKNWWNIISENGMMIIVVPQSTNLDYNVQAFDQADFCYHNWTLVSLIHTLAVSGFDCASGFFLKEPDDPWIHAAVYRSAHEPMDPRTTKWYHLAEKGLIPESAVSSVENYGYVRQRDLVLPWLDKSMRTYARH